MLSGEIGMLSGEIGVFSDAYSLPLVKTHGVEPLPLIKLFEGEDREI